MISMNDVDVGADNDLTGLEDAQIPTSATVRAQAVLNVGATAM